MQEESFPFFGICKPRPSSGSALGTALGDTGQILLWHFLRK